MEILYILDGLRVFAALLLADLQRQAAELLECVEVGHVLLASSTWRFDGKIVWQALWSLLTLGLGHRVFRRLDLFLRFPWKAWARIYVVESAGPSQILRQEGCGKRPWGIRFAARIRHLGTCMDVTEWDLPRLWGLCCAQNVTLVLKDFGVVKNLLLQHMSLGIARIMFTHCRPLLRKLEDLRLRPFRRDLTWFGIFCLLLDFLGLLLFSLCLLLIDNTCLHSILVSWGMHHIFLRHFLHSLWVFFNRWLWCGNFIFVCWDIRYLVCGLLSVVHAFVRLLSISGLWFVLVSHSFWYFFHWLSNYTFSGLLRALISRNWQFGLVLTDIGAIFKVIL